MLITAFGPPTRFGRLGKCIMEAISACQIKEGLFLEVDSPEELYEPLNGRRLRGLILFSTWPQQRLFQVVRRLENCCIVFFDEPDYVFAKAMSENYYDPTASGRPTSKYMSVFTTAAAASGALVFRRGDSTPLGRVIDIIGQRLGIDVDRGAVLRGMTWPGVDFTVAENDTLQECILSMSAASSVLEAEPCHIDPVHFAGLRKIVPDLDELEPKRFSRPILWEQNLFYTQGSSSAISASPEGWQELLGPARYIYFGPYLHLPLGTWKLRAKIRVRDNNAGNKMDFDVMQGEECLAFGRFELPRLGAFEVSTALFNATPEKPIEFRLHLKEGAIDGALVLDQVIWEHEDFAWQGEVLEG